MALGGISGRVVARIPEGVRLYAVGDIHGCARLLRNMHELILEDAYRAAEERRIVVYLGDYIDRGPDSRDVIDLAITGPGEAFECVHLKGNHEAMLLDFLAGVGDIDLWRQNGGGATLRSYGVEDRAEPDELAAAIPAAHCEFYESLRLQYAEGDYFFVHAGVRPGIALDRQSDEDMLWIRHPFLDSDAEWGYTVVHGHSTVAAPDIRPNRINLDTGAVWSGLLTAMAFHGEIRYVLQT